VAVGPDVEPPGQAAATLPSTLVSKAWTFEMRFAMFFARWVLPLALAAASRAWALGSHVETLVSSAERRASAWCS